MSGSFFQMLFGGKLDLRKLKVKLREVEREMEFNEDTKDLVSRTLDKGTGVVLQQYPAEALLKLRAYLRAEDAKTDAGPILVREA